jgi:predicted Zn-dependent peptidase
MKKIFFLILFTQGILMSAVIDYVKIKDINVPFIYEKDNLPRVNLQITFKNSGTLANGEIAGLAKFSSKLLNEGTKKLGVIGFANELEKHAISLNASVGNETFVISLNCLTEEFDYAVSLLKDLLKNPNYTEETLDKIKKRTLSSLMQKKSDFDYIASTNLKSILFKGTPLEYTSIGTEESIKNIKLENIQSFINNHLTIGNAIVVIGGNFGIEASKKIIADLLDVLNSKKSEELAKIKINSTIEEKVSYQTTKQAYIYFGSPYNVSPKDEDAYKARVANFILGSSGFGSRLMEEIRVKRGLAYSAYSKANINNTNSYFSGYLQTKLENQKDAIKIVKEEIDKFIKDGVTQKELDSAKKFLLGSEPLRNETMRQRVSKTFFEFYKGVKIGQGKKDLIKIENLTLDDLNGFIKKHDEIKNLTFSIVTNQK